MKLPTSLNLLRASFFHSLSSSSFFSHQFVKIFFCLSDVLLNITLSFWLCFLLSSPFPLFSETLLIAWRCLKLNDLKNAPVKKIHTIPPNFFHCLSNFNQLLTFYLSKNIYLSSLFRFLKTISMYVYV